LPADERRAAIVAVTIPLLLEHGERLTTRLIADAAGIAEGTLFRVFPDKEAILDAAVDACVDPVAFEHALSSLDPDRPLADVVADAVEISQARVIEVGRVFSSLGPRLRQRKARPLADSPALTRLLEAHRSELRLAPRAAARALRALTFALSHPLMVARPVPAPEIARLFLHGAVERGDAC
jgi:AcrR family transcriptional regulator